MGASGDYKCPICNFIYAQYEHDGNETFYHCDVCGWQGWRYDNDMSKPATELEALPKALKLSKVISPIIAKLWKDEWCVEVFQYSSIDNKYLYDFINEYGLGGAFIKLFTTDMS